MKTKIILMLLLLNTAAAEDKLFTATTDKPNVIQNCYTQTATKTIPRKKRIKGIQVSRKIRVFPTSISEGESWCSTRNGLKYIEVDTLNNNINGSWRYVCKK